jgi:hypothetical protein
MQFLVVILMYLGLLSPCHSYTDAEINSTLRSNVNVVNNYYTQSTDGTVSIKKTVWDHEQL